MPITAKPEILPPSRGWRHKAASSVFDDQHLDMLSHLLDDFLRVPGTPIRFGLDGIVGFHSWHRRHSRRPGVNDHYFRGLGARRSQGDDRPHGDECGDRNRRRFGAGARQPVRYRLASQSAQLQAAGRVNHLSQRNTRRLAGCSSRWSVSLF